MNLNESMISDYKGNELIDDDSDVEDGQTLKEQDEESKYGRVVSVANSYRS